MPIYGAICFNDNDKNYKVKAFSQDLDMVISDMLNFYKNNSLSEIKEFINKIIWVNEDENKEIYNKSHLLYKYIKSNNVNKVRDAELKVKNNLEKSDKSYVNRLFEEEIDPLIFSFNREEFELNFPIINEERYLKIYNDSELNIDNLDYIFIFDINNDELIVSREEKKTVINRDNLNDFIVGKNNFIY